MINYINLTICLPLIGHEKELKKEKWLSVLNHMCNIHAGHGNLFPNCAHGDIDERDWIIKGI